CCLGQCQKGEHGIAVVQQAMRCEVEHFVFRSFSFYNSFARLRANEYLTMSSAIESCKRLDFRFSFRQRTECRFGITASKRSTGLPIQLRITKGQQCFKTPRCRTLLLRYLSQHAQ